LHPNVKPVHDFVKANAAANVKTKLWEVARDVRLPEHEVEQKLRAALDKVEFTINFPFNKTPRGHSQPLGLSLNSVEDPHFLNLFETGHGSGSTDTGARGGWEKRNFGRAVENIPKEERPKYGAVNWEGKEQGPAQSYGESVFVLNHENLKDRITIAPGNSSGTREDQVAHLDDPLNAMLRNGQALEAAGIPTRLSKWDYQEFQVWGKFPINADTIKEIRFPKKYRQTPEGLALKDLAKRKGIPFRYMK
jgi:hypothetical protein